MLSGLQLEIRASKPRPATAIAASWGGDTLASNAGALTVHEWGTFTSIAGEDGRAIEWLALDGPTDLPCFVERARNGSICRVCLRDLDDSGWKPPRGSGDFLSGAAEIGQALNRLSADCESSSPIPGFSLSTTQP